MGHEECASARLSSVRWAGRCALCRCLLPHPAPVWRALPAADLGMCCARAFPVWAAMGALHLGLGLALKLYVFQYWNA